jgi:hypothetical protein
MQNNHTVIQFPKKEQNARKGYGCVYVIGFSNGVVKVGKTKSPERRMTDHKSTLGMVANISSAWVSDYHLNYSKNELILINKLNNGGKEIGFAVFEEIVEFAKCLYLNIECDDEYQSRIKKEAIQQEHNVNVSLSAMKKDLGEKDDHIDDCLDLFPLFKDIDSGMIVKRACIEIASVVTGRDIVEFISAERLDDIIDTMNSGQLSEFNKLQNNLTFILNAGFGFNESINLIRKNEYARIN